MGLAGRQGFAPRAPRNDIFITCGAQQHHESSRFGPVAVSRTRFGYRRDERGRRRGDDPVPVARRPRHGRFLRATDRHRFHRVLGCRAPGARGPGKRRLGSRRAQCACRRNSWRVLFNGVDVSAHLPAADRAARRFALSSGAGPVAGGQYRRGRGCAPADPAGPAIATRRFGLAAIGHGPYERPECVRHRGAALRGAEPTGPAAGPCRRVARRARVQTAAGTGDHSSSASHAQLASDGVRGGIGCSSDPGHARAMGCRKLAGLCRRLLGRQDIAGDRQLRPLQERQPILHDAAVGGAPVRSATSSRRSARSWRSGRSGGFDTPTCRSDQRQFARASRSRRPI